MERDFHFRLKDIGIEKAEYKTRLKLDPTGVYVNVQFPGEETERCVWIEANKGELIVRTYDPEHDGPITTTILAGSQLTSSEGYE